MEFLFEKIATSTFLRITYNPHVEKGIFKTISAMSKKSSAKNEYFYARSNECHASRVCMLMY